MRRDQPAGAAELQASGTSWHAPFQLDGWLLEGNSSRGALTNVDDQELQREAIASRHLRTLRSGLSRQGL